MNRQSFLLIRLALVFLVYVASARAQTFGLNKTRFSQSDEIVATWSGTPGGAKDWIGLYTVPGNAPVEGKSRGVSLTYLYCSGVKAGSVTFRALNLKPGRYVACLLANDGYDALASPVEFTVLGKAGPAAPQFRSEIRLRHAVAGRPMTAKLAAYAFDVDADDTLTFSKVSGPDWISVDEHGALSGAPPSWATGKQTMVVQATDLGGRSAQSKISFDLFAPGKEEVKSLTVMAFNVWIGLNNVHDGYSKGARAIVEADVDIVGVIEPYNAPQAMAGMLGWFADNNGLVSRYPFERLPEKDSEGFYCYRVHLSENPRRDIIVAVVHLDYQHYAPYVAQTAKANDVDVLIEENASRRPAEVQTFLKQFAAAVASADDTPLLVLGDFNTVSHLDWTDAARAKHNGRAALFPISLALERAGLKDSFRELHPNPVLDPGTTWSTIFKGDEPQDRIDYIYYKGRRLRAVGSLVFTTGVENTLGSWKTVGNSGSKATQNNTWPSDHAAVVTRFQVAD